MSHIEQAEHHAQRAEALLAKVAEHESKRGRQLGLEHGAMGSVAAAHAGLATYYASLQR